MPFCKYSSGLINAGTISIEARFLNDYLPIAPDNYLKVYLFGLLKCQNSAGFDNTIENFENVLGLEKSEILKAFLYWQDQNLVQILETDPIEIRYLPQKDNLRNLKKIDSKKYASFVIEVQEIISGRSINPNEFNKYIDFIEDYHILPADFNMIVKYCVDKKGNNINCNYILTVAQAWAEQGITTAEKIEEKIESLTLLTSDVNIIAKALKFKGNLGIEHQQMYEKWIKSFGFTQNTIENLAKKVSSKTKNYSFEYLDKLLTKYYEQKLFSFAEIEEYEANKEDLKELAREVNKALGIYYESVENEVDTYIMPWLNKGFNSKTLIQIANFCFKNNIRTLDGMEQSVQKFHKKGLVSVASIDNHLTEIMATDNRIKEILQNLNIDRRVNSFDRSFYRTWTYSYKYSDEVIDYAISLSTGKINALQYANALLTNWYDLNLRTLEEIKKQAPVKTQKKEPTFERKSFKTKEYSAEEVNALFDNLDEINI